ncbi:putative N-acetyltransferase YesJ [Insulibacter thermoxylanivorax]|uniref:N-acetyltransferase YesJ n=1 Tax=Insulibacter thermoxylanivorax TaxID=2749268 RepID=A0A916QDF5_9BACL|nr:GNAT family N-acetyltransferase [Insulibacter thermoxylanivorax]GFR38696.1 putative N-acetyltransferase YesJ [Insulibacter thermoxylanivorax]
MDYQILKPTIAEHIEVAVAEPKDADEIMDLLIEIAEWFRSRGSKQWAALLEGRDDHKTAEVIHSRRVFIFKDGEEIAGMVILLDRPSPWDIRLWGEDRAYEGDGTIYVHRLAVKRKYAGRGLGRNILNWCSSGIRFPGKHCLRLDCVGYNETLKSFYMQNGFTYLGDEHGYSLFTKELE